MKLSAFKNNQLINEVDLTQEVAGVEDGERSFFIGRSKSCHLTIQDIGISREHIQIIYEKGQWKLKKNADFGMVSLNGSLVDECELKHGDIIAVGAFHIMVSKANTKGHIQESINTPLPSENSTQEPLEEEKITQEEQNQTQQEDPQVEFDEISEENPPEPEEIIDAAADDNSQDHPEENKNENNDMDSSPEFDMGMDQAEGLEANSLQTALPDDGAGDGMDMVANPGEDGGEDKTGLLNSFVKYELELFGEFAPYDNYLIEDVEVFIGREPNKCQIVLQDKEVSTVHAVIKHSKGLAQIEDLNSSNGTIYNGKRINKASISEGDEFIIGSTTFTVKVKSDLLEQEEGRLMPVEENLSTGNTGQMEIGNFSGTIETANEKKANSKNKNQSLIAGIMSDPQKKRRVIMYGSMVILFLFLFSDEGDKSKKVAQKTSEKEKSNLLAQSNGQKKQTEGSKKEQKNEERKKKKKLSSEQEESLERRYKLAEKLFEEGKFSESIFELEKIILVDPNFKEAKQRYALSKKGLAQLEELEIKRQSDEDRRIRNQKAKELLVKAKDAVEKKKVELAEGLFSQILQLDPENFDVAQLKLEIDAYKKEEERIAVEKAQKESERKRQLALLSPGKKFYLSEQWYKAIIKLEEFLEKKNTDEDLVKEASHMLAESRKSLDFIVAPRLSKARSLREGKDLKQAYEVYMDILKFSPGNVEALNEMDDIRSILNKRSKKVYREAIVSEDLSLFEDAKEKYEEVKQITPSDSPYYKKATAKLEEYID